MPPLAVHRLSLSGARAAPGPHQQLTSSDYLDTTAVQYSATQPRRLSTGTFPSVFELPNPAQDAQLRTTRVESHVSANSHKRRNEVAGLAYSDSGSSSRDGSVKRESHSPRGPSPARSSSPPVNMHKRPRMSGPLDSLAEAASSVLQSNAPVPAPPPPMGLGFITDGHHSISQSPEDINSAAERAPSGRMSHHEVRRLSGSETRRSSVGGAPAPLNPEMAGTPTSSRSKGSTATTATTKEGHLGKRRGGDAKEKTKNLTIAVERRPGLEYSPIVPPPPRSAPPKPTTPSVLMPVPESSASLSRGVPSDGRPHTQPSPSMHSVFVDPSIGGRQPVDATRRRQSASAMSPSTSASVLQLPLSSHGTFSALSSYKLPQPTQLPTPIRPDYPRATASFSGRPTSSSSMTHSLSGGVGTARPSSSGGGPSALPPHIQHHLPSTSASNHALHSALGPTTSAASMAGYYTSPPQYRFIQPPPSPTSRIDSAATSSRHSHPYHGYIAGGPRSPPTSHHNPASSSKQAFMNFLSSWYDAMTAETRHLSRQLEDQVRRSSVLMTTLEQTLQDQQRKQRHSKNVMNFEEGELERAMDKRMSHVADDLSKEIEAFAMRLHKCEQSLDIDEADQNDHRRQASGGSHIDEVVTSRERGTNQVPVALLDRLDKLERTLGQVSRRISDGSSTSISRRRISSTSNFGTTEEQVDHLSDEEARRKLSSDSGSTNGTMVQEPSVTTTISKVTGQPVTSAVAIPANAAS
ncbi:hypothetical protein OIO90_002613 [Microbotryomycetes sp. JL221]|nr:hypothetical protein OIO90_002613 [Microbotryomycetes sp. JL221]